MPYKGEHAARINKPSKYKSFNRVNGAIESGGKKIDVIYGIFQRDGKNVSEIQALRYSTKDWTEAQAREHSKKFNPILFEPAKSTVIDKNPKRRVAMNIVNKTFSMIKAVIPEWIWKEMEGFVYLDIETEGNSKTIMFKADDDKQIVYGIVYEPDEEDTQGELATAEEIEKACHEFTKGDMLIKLRHKGDAIDTAKVVETYIAPVSFAIIDPWGDKQVIKKGSWIVAAHIEDVKLWKRVKDGEFNGFSMGGTAHKEPVT
jgi:hypothetical protein